MEDLLVGRVRRRADLDCMGGGAEPGPDVPDVGGDHVGAPAREVGFLAAPDGADVRQDACVDAGVFLARMPI